MGVFEPREAVGEHKGGEIEVPGRIASEGVVSCLRSRWGQLPEVLEAWIMSVRPLLSEQNKTDRVKTKIADFNADAREEVRQTVEREAVVVVGMAQNPFVRKVRRALDGANIPFSYLEYGSYLTSWKERLAIKMWSGWPTFPQVFVRGTLIGGNAETTRAIEDGTLREMLDAKAA